MKYLIIGTGNISNTYAQALAELPGSELVACVSRSGKRPAKAQSLSSFPDLDSVKVEYDAVIVATPNGLHTDSILAAAKRGKHVLVEKPLGIDMEQMEKAVAACAAKDLTLAVAYQRRTAPDNMAVKAAIERGLLGHIFSADLSAKYYRDQAYYDSAEYRGGLAIDGGGPFIQQAAHQIDIYTWFFGLPQKVVSAMGTFTHRMEGEDHGAALLRHENGMIGTIVASTATIPGFAAQLQVHTEKGSFTMVDDVITEWHFEDVSNPSLEQRYSQHEAATEARVSDTSAHKMIIRDFEKAVREGGSPIADGPSAMATSALILDIYRSAMD